MWGFKCECFFKTARTRGGLSRPVAPVTQTEPCQSSTSRASPIVTQYVDSQLEPDNTLEESSHLDDTADVNSAYDPDVDIFNWTKQRIPLQWESRGEKCPAQ